MPFEIMPRGAAISIVVRDTDTGPLLRSGLCERLDDLLPGYARDPEIYCTILRPIPEPPGPGVEAPRFEDRAAGARLAWRLECYSKPTISLIDTPISGYLAGLVMNGTHRVAGDAYRFRVQPADLLHACDGGLAHWLSHLGPGAGAYLVATGRSVGGEEALRLGLVTHLVPAAQYDEIEAGLADAEPVDPLLDDRHVALPAGPAERALHAIIAEAFASCRLDDIRARLAADEGSGRQDIARRLRTEVEATAAGGRLEDALGVLRAASRTDMRSTLVAGLATIDPGRGLLGLPTRGELQALRNR